MPNELDIFQQPSLISDDLTREATYLTYPISSMSNFIMETMIAGNEVDDLSKRKKQYNHSQKIEVSDSGKSGKVVRMTKGQEWMSVTIPDTSKLSSQARKMYVLAMTRANEQCLFNGELGNDTVTFNIRDLIDIGFYSTPQSARKGFDSAVAGLASISVDAEVVVNKKRRITVTGIHPFRKAWRDHATGQCYIQLEEDFNWQLLARQFTKLPEYYYRLSSNASILLEYIFYLARMNGSKIKECGYFTISNKAIQQRLWLPGEADCKNPKRDIQGAIEKAISEIEEFQNKYYRQSETSPIALTLDPVFAGRSITEYLESGYLKVSMYGDLAAYYIECASDKAKKIQTAMKRKQANIERNTQKKLLMKMDELTSRIEGIKANEEDRSTVEAAP